jgi:hypothetical protein
LGNRVDRYNILGGTSAPQPGRSKYAADTSFQQISNLPVPLGAGNLISAAYSKATWDKHNSALSSLAEFEHVKGIHISWPLSTETILSYIQWATREKKLLPGTVKSYLSSLCTVHKLRLLNTENFEIMLVKAALRGAENLHKMNSSTRPKRVVMTIQLLKILGHEIASSTWGEDSKRVVWTACTVAFFGTLRLGEILHHSESSFDPAACLLWNCVKFLECGSILIHIRSPKSDCEEGDFVDIFPFPGCCPVQALRGLAQSRQGAASTTPVFQFSSGKLLTVSKFTTIVRMLLSKHLGAKSALVQAKLSFPRLYQIKAEAETNLFQKVVNAINSDI